MSEAERTVFAEALQAARELAERRVEAENAEPPDSIESGGSDYLGSCHPRGSSKNALVELRGFEPLTPSMPWRCATNCATAPSVMLMPRRGLRDLTQTPPFVAKSAATRGSSLRSPHPTCK